MAQQFQADAQQSAAAPAVVNGTPLNLIATNFINPPYGNCKVKTHGSCRLSLGSIPTTVRLQVFRNPAAENVAVADSGTISLGVAANALGLFTCDGVDLVPDGRPVQYQLTVTLQGTGTNGQAAVAYVDANMLSG